MTKCNNKCMCGRNIHDKNETKQKVILRLTFIKNIISFIKKFNSVGYKHPNNHKIAESHHEPDMFAF